jgi:hypothetical protein
MSKNTDDGELRITRLADDESTPPLLSDELIAKLQGAVEAAQRKRPPYSPNDAVRRDEGKQAHALDADRHC